MLLSLAPSVFGSQELLVDGADAAAGDRITGKPYIQQTRSGFRADAEPAVKSDRG